jgi:dTDP-4-amino-4,6-dideoxygalactose transaminase
MNLEKKIYVTQPDLPPLDEFIPMLERIWNSKILTNNGPFHQQFERALADYLGVKHLSLFSNGTLALITALKALGIDGEVITTPFSFVATTHALWWNNITPVFADIEPVNFNLDPKKVELAITPRTKAILPVHVYGNPCDVVSLKQIADAYGLKLIYDAAHAFGVKINYESVLNFGELSILSFHATKVFNTMEGGAIICHDEKTKQHIDNLKNFGIVNETTIVTQGINAKMNELQAAFGLLQLKYVDENISKRKKITESYRQQLHSISGIKYLDDVNDVTHNYSYFPILIDALDFGISRDELYEELRAHNVFGRKYFYPLISHIKPYREFTSAYPTNLPTAEKVAKEVLCLPIHTGMNNEDINRVVEIIRKDRS